MHGMIMVIYLLTALFLGGFGNYLIPLMVGARDMAFPYVNMLSYWVYLLAVLVLVAGFFAPGGPTGAGWTLYPPQAILSGTPGHDWGIILMLVLADPVHHRLHHGRPELCGDGVAVPHPRHDADAPAADGMGHFHRHRHGTAGLPGVVRRRRHDAAGPAAGHQLLHAVRGASWANNCGYAGGSPILFQHLFWFFGHPEVYIVALPAFGIVSDLISTHARKNIFGYRMMVWAIVGIGALSFVVWAHHMYVSGMDPYFGFFFATTTLIIAVPTAIKVYNWVLTLWRGDIHLTVPMLFALGFIVTFVNGGLTGLFLGNVVVDVPLSATMFVVAHFHMVMGVAPILVVFGGIYHWYPKVTGRMLDDDVGQDPFLGHVPGRLCDLFPDALPRPAGRAAPLLRTGRDRLHSAIGRVAERVHHHRRVDRGRGANGVPVQSDMEPVQGQAGRRQSLAGHDAGMADAANPARTWQLGQGTAGGLSLGL